MLVPNVIIATENVVTHPLPNLSREKSKLPLFSKVGQCMGDHILCAYYHTTLGTSNGKTSKINEAAKTS